METKEANIVPCTSCDVPAHLHGAACGWKNAAWIMYPENQQQNEWSRKWMDAHPGAYPARRKPAA